MGCMVTPLLSKSEPKLKGLRVVPWRNYETNRNDIFDTLSTFKAEVILIIVLFCLLMLMISIKDTLTLNATSIDLIPVYIFCRLNNILIFWNMHHAKMLLVLRVTSIYWGFKIEPHWFNGCVYQRRLQILAVIFICGFHGGGGHRKYVQVYLIALAIVCLSTKPIDSLSPSAGIWH